MVRMLNLLVGCAAALATVHAVGIATTATTSALFPSHAHRVAESTSG